MRTESSTVDLPHLADRQNVVIVGLGNIGMPLAHECVRAKHRVSGLDVAPTIVNSVNSGTSHVDDVSNAQLAEMIAAGFRATTDASVIASANTVIICVPTPLHEGLPELTALRASAQAISENIQPGMLVILESTTYPGTTEEVLAPILERSGLQAGRDFGLVFSPERIDPANRRFGVHNTPKVIGGLTPDCTARAVDFYSTIVEQTVPAKGTREAEMAKLLENTYRHVNIALVNELAQVSHELGIDFWNALDCAVSKPFGYSRFEPGPGVGGHCIPIDPNYLSALVKAKLGYPLRMVELAQEINHRMPHYVVSRIQDLLNTARRTVNGAHILLVGITYKANVSDIRETPAVPIAQRLVELGAHIAYHDPHVATWSVAGRIVRRAIAGESHLYDVAVFLQHHDGIDVEWIQSASSATLDTRGKLRGRSTQWL